MSSFIQSNNGTNMIKIYLDYSFMTTLLFSIMALICFQTNNFILLKLYKLFNYILFQSCYILILIIYTHFLMYDENVCFKNDSVYTYINFTFVKLIHCYQINLIDDFICLIRTDTNRYSVINSIRNLNISLKYFYVFQMK